MKGFSTKVLAVSLVFLPAPAYAMHISEGILPPSWAGLWWAVAVVFIFFGIRQVQQRKRDVPGYLPLLGIAGSAVFVLSCFPIPVPIAGTCSHPAGTGMSAILLGPFASVLVASVGLLIQALFMAHGGITTFGANVLSMGVVGSFAGWFFFRGSRKMGLSLFAAGFAAGVAADLFTYLTTSVELGLALHGAHPVMEVITKIFVAFMPTQGPLAVLEGVMTGGLVRYVHRHRPEILVRMGIVKAVQTVQTA
ncbi:MAG: energy-coupling factor ABC transporter permease [Deltaproteobacteria bacterium]|nr:energy-coupling factor ABC transporter permease [Deltaproteobacteria bacterium]